MCVHTEFDILSFFDVIFLQREKGYFNENRTGHPEPDSGSIHLSVIDINRFRVKHGMTKLGDNRFFTSLGERSQLCESNELQMRVRVNQLLSAC